MNKALLKAFKRWSAPAVYDAVKWKLGTRFGGNYKSWQEAKGACHGYDDAAILQRIVEATRAVVRGRAAAERDGVELDQNEYSWPLLASLLFIAGQQEGSLRVLDFGGSLGSTYRQNNRFLRSIREVKWAVVEQPSFVSAGRLEFQDDTLRFFERLDVAFKTIWPNVILLSSVLQYVEEPYAVLDQIFELNPQFILLDRTPLIDAPEDRLTVQTVSKRVYPGSYPAWFFSRSRFMERFQPQYELVESFQSADRVNIPSEFMGALFRRSA